MAVADDGPGTWRWKDRRRLFRYGAAALALTAAAATWLFLTVGDGAPEPDPKQVVVATFENRTGDHSLDPIGRLAANRIAVGLERTGAVKAVASDSRKRPTEDLARDAGAGLVSL